MPEKKKPTKESEKRLQTHSLYLPRETPEKLDILESLPSALHARYNRLKMAYPFASLHNAIPEWRKAEQRISPFTRFIFLWLDYALACENLACAFYGNQEFAQHYEPRLTASAELTEEQNSLCKTQTYAKLEYKKAAEQFCGDLFTANKLWILPRFPYPPEFNTFSEWLEAATGVHEEMSGRIEHAISCDDWKEQHKVASGSDVKIDLRKEAQTMVFDGMNENEVWYSEDISNIFARINETNYHWEPTLSQRDLLEIFIPYPEMSFTPKGIQARYQEKGGDVELSDHFRIQKYFKGKSRIILDSLIIKPQRGRYQLNQALIFRRISPGP